MIFRFILLLGVFLMTYSQDIVAQERWEAPAEADTLQNPFSSDDEAVLASGADFFVLLCASCHGPAGDGSGGAGQMFDPPPADFTTDVFQQQSDGAIFWKLSEGNPPAMLSYREILSEEERWQIVTYLRQFAPDPEE